MKDVNLKRDRSEMREGHSREKLVASIKAFRAGYIPDIEKFGEDYWKEKLLVTYGSYAEACVDFADYYPEEIADGLDNHCWSILTLVRVLAEDFS